MIKVLKFYCLIGVNVQKNGTFTYKKTYWGRVASNGCIMLLSNEGQWITALDTRMITGLPPIANFLLTKSQFVKNKKELKALTGGLS